MNQSFMTMTIAHTLDGPIINQLNQRMITHIISVEARSGQNNFCMKYLNAFGAGIFE
jgi:hypothetical protein